MLVAGTSLAILQKQHQGYAAASQAKQQEQRTIQNLHGNFAKRSTSQQHTDQENECLRTGKCSNAGLGIQTLGNDNSVTGFTDQSKNAQVSGNTNTSSNSNSNSTSFIHSSSI
jgi:hypothetical protein